MSITLTKTTQKLKDAHGRMLGIFVIEDIEMDYTVGTFQPSRDFESVRPLFEVLETIIERQVLSLLDQAWAPINELEITLDDGTRVHNLQIYADGQASFQHSPTTAKTL